MPYNLWGQGHSATAVLCAVFFYYSIMALIPLMNGGDVCCGNGTRAEKQEMSWGTGDSVPSVVVSRPWSWSRCAA